MSGEQAWQLKRSSRRTVAIHIRRDGYVEVRAPLRYPLNAIEAFVRSRQAWIDEQLKRVIELPALPQWGEGRQWWHQGQTWPVHIEQVTNQRARVQVCFSTTNANLGSTDAAEYGFTLSTPMEPAAWPQLITKSLQAWQAAQAKQVLPARVEALVAQHGEQWRPTALRFRCLRSRWGSCSADGRIMLNTQLMQLPEHLVDYVICHEMAHLREMNHSAAFYAVQTRLNPEWQVQRAEMKQWATRLVTSGDV